MSRGGGGGGGRRVFLSAHRCPEVDLLPRRLSEEEARPPCSPPPAESSSGETAYLDVCSDKDDQADYDARSDWSEEDLSLHFSPSVILQSEDEESDPESGFECVDVTVATQGAGPKMVPKRQIQLKRKNVVDQVKHATAEVGRVKNGTSAVCPRSDLLLRQHSMPASLRLISNSDIVGPVGGASQGSQSGGRRLQKSLSLDETKTKQASSLITSVLSKRMQVEKTSTFHLKSSPVLPIPASQTAPQTASQTASQTAPQTASQTASQTGPVHVVRDVRGLLKSTSRHPLSTSSQVIGPKDSPPPSYQQALRVRGEIRGSTGRPVTERRRGGEPIRPGNSDDVTNTVLGSMGTTAPASDLIGQSQSKRSVAPGPPIPPGSAPPQPVFCVQDQRSILGVSSRPTQQPRCVHGPLSCFPTQLPAPVLQHQDQLTETVPGPLDRTRTTGGQQGGGAAETPAARLPPRRQPLLCSFQRFLPAQVGGDFPVDVTGSAAAPGAPFGSAPHLMVEPKRRQCFYLEAPPQPQVKMLLDPETGQFVKVVLPAAGSTPSSALYPVGYAHPALSVLSPAHSVMNPTPIMLQVANHPMFSVMHLHPRVGVSHLYPLPLKPMTVMTPHPPHSDDVTPDAQ